MVLRFFPVLPPRNDPIESTTASILTRINFHDKLPRLKSDFQILLDRTKITDFPRFDARWNFRSRIKLIFIRGKKLKGGLDRDFRRPIDFKFFTLRTSVDNSKRRNCTTNWNDGKSDGGLGGAFIGDNDTLTTRGSSFFANTYIYIIYNNSPSESIARTTRQRFFPSLPPLLQLSTRRRKNSILFDRIVNRSNHRLFPIQIFRS